MIDRDKDLVVAPSMRAVLRIAHDGGRAETLRSMRRRLVTKLAPNLTLASPEASRMALSEVLAKMSLREFSSRGASRARAIEAFDAAIGALFSAGTTIAMLERVATFRGVTAERAALLARVVHGTVEALARAGLVDRRVVGAELAHALARVTPEEVVHAVGAERVVAKFIVAWSPVDLLWWRALDASLSRTGGFARVALPYFSKAIDAERERDPLEVLIDDVAQKLDAPPETIAIESRFGDLRFIEDAVPVEIDLRRASNRTAQARAIADAVLVALANGARADEIAIVLADFDDTTIDAIERVFGSINVPLHVSRGGSPSDTPVVKTAMRALSFVIEESSRVELRALERSPFVGADVLRVLTNARASHVRSGTWGERIRAARALLSELDLATTCTGSVRSTLAHDDTRGDLDRMELRAHAANARALASLHASLDAIEAGAVRLEVVASSVDASEFLRTLECALENHALPPASSLAGAVFLGRFADVAGEPLALLVVADANEGALPPRPQLPIVITEAVAAKLREIDRARAPLSNYVQSAMDWSALAAAAARARRVVLTYRTQGTEGDAVGPSQLVAWLARSGISESDWHAGPLAGHSLNAREAAFCDLAFAEKTRLITHPDETRRAKIELARESYHSTHVGSDLTGDVSRSPEALLILANGVASATRPLSITSLEEFARCAFRGFARATLGARAAESASEAPDARERGQLVHEALRAAVVATMSQWSTRPRDRDAIRTHALEAARESLRSADAADEFSPTRVALRGIVHRQVLEEFTRILDFTLADETWDPMHAEQSFGKSREETSWPALPIMYEGFRATLQGEIDRVDVAHGDHSRVRAVDYKSSPAVAKDAHKKLGETTLQVPLYARAAMQSTNADRAEGLYLPTRDIAVALAGREKFERAWEQIGAAEKSRPDLERRVAAILEPVRRGLLFPRPYQDDFAVCDRCDYDGVCRRPRFVVTEEEVDEDATP